tara:strand:+ start:356 stop:514 length:159 start_codon:yes stop_codon:yes gene_type:complete
MVVILEEQRKTITKKAWATNALVMEYDYKIGLFRQVRLTSALKSVDNDGRLT